VFFKIIPAASEPAHHISARNVMPTLFNPGGDTPEAELRRRNSQIDNFDPAASSFPALQQSNIRKPTQRTFESEVGVGFGEPFEFFAIFLLISLLNPRPSE
jgi:hypothetical protein